MHPAPTALQHRFFTRTLATHHKALGNAWDTPLELSLELFRHGGEVPPPPPPPLWPQRSSVPLDLAQGKLRTIFRTLRMVVQAPTLLLSCSLDLPRRRLLLLKAFIIWQT
jgi:hypothetical protein